MGGAGLAGHAAALCRPAHRRVTPRSMAERGFFPWGLGRHLCAHGQRRHLTPLTKQVGRLILNAPLLPSTTQVERPTDNTLRLVLLSSESASAACTKPSHFVLRVKIPAEAEALQAAINKCVSKQ